MHTPGICDCSRDGISASRQERRRGKVFNPPAWSVAATSRKQTPSLPSSFRTQQVIPNHFSIIGYSYLPEDWDSRDNRRCRAIARAETDRKVVRVETWQTGTERAGIGTIFLSPAFDLFQLLRIARSLPPTTRSLQSPSRRPPNPQPTTPFLSPLRNRQHDGH